MYLARRAVEAFYDFSKPAIFRMTQKNPERAHEEFLFWAELMHDFGLDGFLLNNSANKVSNGLKISNAAGFNKNGKIYSAFLKYLGFDRNVVGTVTGDPWPGNPDEQRIWRYPDTASMVNFLGLPGIGAEAVRRNLDFYAGNGELSITLNLMSTPKKTGEAAREDVRKTVRALRYFPFIDRWELNGSCPNTLGHSVSDGRRENQKILGSLIEVIHEEKRIDQEIDLKVSPDLEESGIEDTYAVAVEKGIRRLTTTNTTTVHDLSYIPNSPGKGGASGQALYERSLRVQKAFAHLIAQDHRDIRIIACGGIDSVEKARDRTEPCMKSREIQIYTSLIYNGPRIVRELRRSY